MNKSMEKRGLIIASVSVVLVLGLLIILIAGKTFYPDNEIIDFIWKGVWLGVLPLMLVFSYRLAVKGKEESKKDGK
jgi:cytochrome c biogenesis protein CcdA